MAEEEAQQGAQQEQPSSAGEPQVSGGSKLLPVIIIVLLLLGVAGGLAYYFLVYSSDKLSVEAASPEEAKFMEAYLKRSQPSVESIKQDVAPVFTPVFAYTVNMADKRHMMQLSFKAKLYDELARDHLMKYRPVIDNNMMDLLSRLKAADLRNRAGLEMLKLEILLEMNRHFNQEFIELSETKDRMPVKEILIAEYYIN